MIDTWDGEMIVLDDFIEVRMEKDRFGSSFNIQGANDFNNFISSSGLIDIPLGGYSYTWAYKSAYNMSKLDRFLVSEGLLVEFPHLLAKVSIKCKLIEVDKLIDKGEYDNDTLIQRASLLNDLNVITSKEALDVSQKAKIRWSIEGDENLNVEHVEELECLSISMKSKMQFGNVFFSTCIFPPGCNSTFIALIPKIHDAKTIKDFCPISLIGSVYKIIAKILANRFNLVISDLNNEVQTTFVPNRQILDGLLILNELISWCKHKKINAMIFKVDFEKAFDSVRSPASEFQFHKGLKQGDMLSPFLFILVMESLHRSFTRVMEAGLYKSISINKYISISHLFYADDAVFVGEWNISNIKTIMNVLKFIFMASSLKTNLYKSKLLGFGVAKTEIEEASLIMVCSTFSSYFHYLGVKVGASIYRINSWQDVIDKISSRLSKWKIKTLSSYGKLTLLKSIQTALPLYYMSMYKALAAILRELESIRRDFYGCDKVDRKIVWIEWENILASNPTVGLVSPAYTPPPELFFSNGYGDLLHVLPFGLTLSKQFMESKSGRRATKNLVSITSQVLLPQMSDHCFWSLDGSGEFTVRSVRNYIDDVLLLKHEAPTRWVKIILFKINILAWKISLDRLPTRFNISYRGLEFLSIVCPLCNAAVETSSHVFFSCTLARQIMHKMYRWWDLDTFSFTSYGDCLSWVSNVRLAKDKKGILEEYNKGFKARLRHVVITTMISFCFNMV
uniref:RNA-directed DNA polymerase, eukaryota n=1 Tax=Tanacetum cinerariifolium TaxID=118510 RepID=A0A699HHS1_TANCI|nr:RNA-directed DNA polymerase, eukaryota [Tanacetum cinerariifolium]